MNKELITKQDYLDAHLKEFEAIQAGKKVKGIIFVENNNVFLLNNEYGSSEPINKCWKDYGYKYSHLRLVFEGFKTYFNTLTIEEQWQPKFGELVEVSINDRTWYKRIFVGEYAGKTHCIHEEDVKFFEADTCESYRVLQWNFIRQIEEPKTIEISLEEAKSIIAKERGVDITQINLNFNIK